MTFLTNSMTPATAQFRGPRRGAFIALGAAAILAIALLGCQPKEPNLPQGGQPWPGAKTKASERIAATVAGFAANLAPEKPWYVAVLKGGRLIYEGHRDAPPETTRPIASIVKSMIASAYGIELAAGRAPGLDEKLVDHFPEIAEATGAAGPQLSKGAHFTEKDHDVTFRMLLNHTSGLLDADQPTGFRLHYATVPKVVTLNVLARAAGHYHPDDPMLNGGTGEYLRKIIAEPIASAWEWTTNKIAHQPESRWELFGNFPVVQLSPHDMLRFGYLWLNDGRWGNEQVIPADWHRSCRNVTPGLLALPRKRDQLYGRGFWCNSEGRLWPSMPRDAHMAAGFGGHRIIMLPDVDSVIVAAPLPLEEGRFADSVRDEQFPLAIWKAIRGR